MINIKFGKFTDGKFSYAPNPIRVKTEMICNPTYEMYAEHGYKPITYTNIPVKEGFYYTPFYTEREKDILQEWEEHEIIEEPTDADYEAALERLGVK